jgi:hypothetical protein
MACRTLVIGWPNGSVLEVVADGETGSIVESVEEMAAAIDRLGALEPGTLPASSTVTTTQHSPSQVDTSCATPASLRRCCGKHEPRTFPSCQLAVSDRAQARVNQEGTAPTARRDAGRGYPRTKEAPMSRLTRGLVLGAMVVVLSGRGIGQPIRRRRLRAPRWE